MPKNLPALVASLAAAMLLNATTLTLPASALPLQTGGMIATTEPATTEPAATPVQWRRGPRGLRWFGPGPGVAILGGVLIGGAIVAAAIAEHRADGNAMRRCAREFPSFDPRSGTFVDGRGEVVVCPYLY